MTDIEIANSVTLKPIEEIALKVGLDRDSLELHGRYKAKVCLEKTYSDRKGNLILVSAITPTPAGEGKTTTTIGLADALSLLGKKTSVALRQPSMGPVFGIKGGATGGGFAQVAPMEEINLNFTGDFHAIESANNLLSAMIDNHIFQGNELGIDVRTITWKRCMDMNDRQLRSIVCGLGGKKNGCVREDGFDITVASEIMAILCLSDSVGDLKRRLSSIIVAHNTKGEPVTAGDLKAAGAMAAILRDAIKPNIVQTLGGTPAFIHGGPFANIAHGCNSYIATRLALSCSDYVVTEAGFGGDLGAEKFFDIKCQTKDLDPKAVVIVATVRALKMHGGVRKDELSVENLDALEKGLSNLYRHVENMESVFSMPCVVALNRFPGDTEKELSLVMTRCAEKGIAASISEVWAKGGEGALELAGLVLDEIAKDRKATFSYSLSDSLETKISKIATSVYHADGVVFASGVRSKLSKMDQSLPVCMAKTQYSFSDDPKKLCAPEGFEITVRDVKLCAGAGFVVVYTGEILTMPGLPKVPQATFIDIDDNLCITGLM